MFSHSVVTKSQRFLCAPPPGLDYLGIGPGAHSRLTPGITGVRAARIQVCGRVPNLRNHPCPPTRAAGCPQLEKVCKCSPTVLVGEDYSAC